ncbi:hypothetical protein BDZ97DRAFT_1926889 [Flammula alnicola]|nr:hypothetical protein BDZ97DRAFT_1926889 [Flammula alnicola]
MTSTSDDHFSLIRAYIKQTSKIFVSFRASNTHPSHAEIRMAIDILHGPLTQHVRRFPDDAINSEVFRAFLMSLLVAAHQLPSRPPSWNEWLIQNTPANFNPNNHFLRTTRLAPSYMYVGDPGEEEDTEVVESDGSESSVEVSRQVTKVGPPTKCKRMEPSPPLEPHRPSAVGSSRQPAAPSPVPSVSTRSRTQAMAAPPAHAKSTSLNSTPAPNTIVSSFSRTRKTSVRAVSPVTQVIPSGFKTRKTSSIVAPQDSDDDQVDELEDDHEPAPKPSKGKGKNKKSDVLPREVTAQRILAAPGPAHPEAISASQVDFSVTARLQNPGRCLACATHMFKGEPHECKFVGWGRRCGPCKRGGKAHCTFELNPQELDQVLASISPLVSSSRHHLQALVVQINRLFQDTALFAQLSDRANRHAAHLVMQLMKHAHYIKMNFPPGHIVGPHFEGMDVLDTLLNDDYSLLDAYLNESVDHPGFPSMDALTGFFAKLPHNDASTALAYVSAIPHSTLPSRSAASSEVAATQPSAADLFNEDVLSGTRDSQEPDNSREADELDELDDAPMQTDN